MGPLLLLEVNDENEDELREVTCCFHFLRVSKSLKADGMK